MTDLEKDVERRICKYIEGIGGLALKLVLDSERGFPDRTLILPGGQIIFAEVKRPKDAKTANAQLIWQYRLQERGFRCEFVSSMQEVAALVKNVKIQT